MKINHLAILYVEQEQKQAIKKKQLHKAYNFRFFFLEGMKLLKPNKQSWGQGDQMSLYKIDLNVAKVMFSKLKLYFFSGEKVAQKIGATAVIFQSLPKWRKFAQSGRRAWGSLFTLHWNVCRYIH
jgi:hypothetical protein